jgi:hypothetical protein
MADPIILELKALPAEVVCEISGIMTSNVFGGPLEVTTEIWSGTDNPTEPGLPAILWDNYHLDVTTQISGEGWLIPTNMEFVEWSKIGDAFDFHKDDSHESGRLPMEYPGWIYQAKQLADKMVMYGENGVTILKPAEQYWASQTILNIGLKGTNSVAGTNNVHFFVDNLGQLWKLTDSLKMLDYSEFLLPATANLTLSYDHVNDLLYLCDGVIGFLYCDGSQSFGKGPINITGIGYQYGTLKVTSSSAIVTPIFDICTDIYDFGTRKGKSIISIEFGTDVVTPLKVSIDYRYDKAKAFNQTPWYTVDTRGIYYISIYGKEFRFRLKSYVWEYFELDYINVNYRVHDH